MIKNSDIPCYRLIIFPCFLNIVPVRVNVDEGDVTKQAGATSLSDLFCFHFQIEQIFSS